MADITAKQAELPQLEAERAAFRRLQELSKAPRAAAR